MAQKGSRTAPSRGRRVASAPLSRPTPHAAGRGATRTRASVVRRRRRGHAWLPVVGAFCAFTLSLSFQSFASAYDGGFYTVQAGDTLGAIALATGVAVDRLAQLNGLSDPNVIQNGETLHLSPSDGTGQTAASTSPPSQVGAAAPAAPSYLVRDGDTLWDIATKLGVTVNALSAANGLSDGNSLTIGQKLSLPPGASLPSAGSARTGTGVASTSPPVSLTQRVISEGRRVGGNNVHFGVAAKNLVTGETVLVRSTDEFPSASVMKLPLLLELERQVGSGTQSWTQTLRSEALAVATVSDNPSANAIMDAVGKSNVNATVARLGLTGTQLVNHFSDTRGGGTSPGENMTTPQDMETLVELIARDQILTTTATADLRSLLARNTDGSKLARLLPSNTRLWHKSGWFDGVANDVGGVTVDRTGARWVIAVMSENDPDAETGNQLIAVISRAVYDAWSPGS